MAEVVGARVISSYSGQALRQVVVDFGIEDGRHDKLGVVDPDLGLEDVGHDVNVVLAGDDQVDRVLAGPVQLLDLGDRFPTSVLDFAAGVLDDQLQVLPRGLDARGQVENSALKQKAAINVKPTMDTSINGTRGGTSLGSGSQ